MKKLLLLMLLLAVPLLARPVPFKPFTDNRFTASFPGVPQVSTQSNDSPLGKITTQIFTCPCNYGSFTVTYSQLPSIAATFGEGKAFDGARDSLVQDAKATVVSYTDWQHGDDDAKILIYGNNRIQGKAWLIMVGSRLYVVDARTKKGTPAAQIDPFFNSLKTVSN